MYSHIIMLSAEAVTSIDRSVPMSERLFLGIKTLLLGMGIVMLVLAFLWGILELFKVIFYDVANIKKEAKISAEPESAEMFSSDEPVFDGGTRSDEEIVAAITAAITAYRAVEPENEYTGGFRVVSFRKTKTVPAVKKS